MCVVWSFAQADRSFDELMEDFVDLLKDLRGREQIRSEGLVGLGERARHSTARRPVQAQGD